VQFPPEASHGDSMIKETYEKLKKKFNLPDYEEVNNELEISSVESEDFLLRQIRKKISERIETITTELGSILQPSAESLTDMHECRFFDDKEKKKMIETYKKLMIISRTGLEAEIGCDDRKDADMINNFFKEWKSLKKDVLAFMKKMKTCWEKETEIEEKLEYFG
jgi:hypothetical protein